MFNIAVQIVAVIMGQGATLRNQRRISVDIKRKTTINEDGMTHLQTKNPEGLDPARVIKRTSKFTVREEIKYPSR